MIIPDFYELIFPFFISWNMPDWLYNIVLRIFLLAIDFSGLSSLLWLVSYFSTGLYYDRGSSPALGSAYYTFFYFLYSLIPVLLILYFYWWVIVVIFICYILLCGGLFGIAWGLDTLPDNWLINIIAHAIFASVLFVAVCLIKGLCF